MKNWQPTTSLRALQDRALLYQKIRQFFAERGVLEVETPLLCHYGVTDVHIDNIRANVDLGNTAAFGFLQTSPEYAMKRLLAQWGQPIYQICKAFRNDECGQYHNPEFTMLEWYRPQFTHHELMDEMDALLQRLLACSSAKRYSYQEIFTKHVGINPFRVDLADCLELLAQHQIALSDAAKNISTDNALQLIMSHLIEPHLGFEQPAFIYDYPSTQAALAKLSAKNPNAAERFEVYIHGVELANGFNELADAAEQQMRFQRDQETRLALGLPARDIDPRFLAALQHGLPDCAGVALGIDRLLMILAGEKHINKVIHFCWDNA